MNYTEEFYSHVKIGIEEVEFNEHPESPEELFDFACSYAGEQMDNIYGYRSGWKEEVDFEGATETQDALFKLAAQIFKTM